MSNKKRKPKQKNAKPGRPGRVISPQQSARFREAVHAQSSGNLAFAEAVYRALIAEKVKTPELYNNLAVIRARSGNLQEARFLWEKALAVDPRFPDARLHLANADQQAGEIESAVSGFQRLLSDHPQMFVARYLLANLLKAQGKIAEAVAHYEKIMQQQPSYTQAHFTYSGVHKYRDSSDPHIAEMLGLYQKKGLKSVNRIHLAFALAKAYEDIGDYTQAFEYLEDGNRLRYETFNYSIEGDEALFSNIMQTFSREAISRVPFKGEPSDKPVFIVGMPRSGTSLVEKILASHSHVHGGGELDYFFAFAAEHFLGESNNFLFGALDSYTDEEFEAAGKAYLEKIKLLDDQASRITDKLPLNFMMVGLIKIVLPHAKIIHCVRDKRDNCLSIYKNNFNTENYQFAYDLKTVAQFHNLYRKLMCHWNEVMPGAMYEVEYEALVQNPEREIHNLLSACDLVWEENCLHFDKSEALVKTASFYQVRQPMFTSSVELWKKYQDYLGPLLDELSD